MNKIKFISNFPKLWNQSTAKLVDIKLIDRDNIHQDFIEYDTKMENGEYYNLGEHKKFIVLYFIGDKGIPFCTLRSFTFDKFADYLNKLTRMFLIEVENG